MAVLRSFSCYYTIFTNMDVLNPDQTDKVKMKKPAFRRISEWLHLWLGLISGIIVFVVCLTGGIWVFRYEVWYFTEKYQRVVPQEKPVLPPSVLIQKAGAYLQNNEHAEGKLTGITYGGSDRAAICSFGFPEEKYAVIYVNPYTGDVVKDKREESAAEQFFVFVRAGHRFFWLPKEIGSPLVGSACIVFVISLVTGLIWWYPQKWTKKTKEKSFRIKWNAKWKRLNIDLHNVLGFYSLIFVLLLTITGIVFTFEWFENGVYKTLTWKTKTEQAAPHPSSDTTIIATAVNNPEDIIWNRIKREYGSRPGRIFIDIPQEPKDPYRVMVNFGDGTILYNNALHYYDQKTLKTLSAPGERAIPYKMISTGEKIFRMNFDIHTGQILGLPSKIIAFLACVIGASLPVTGFIIWYNRKWGKKRRKAA